MGGGRCHLYRHLLPYVYVECTRHDPAPPRINRWDVPRVTAHPPGHPRPAIRPVIIHHHFVYGASSLALAGPPFNTTAVTLDVGVWIVAPLDTPRHGEVPSSWRGDEKPRFGCSAGFAPAGEIPDLVNGR